MQQEFISYEQALALKKLGFDEECFAIYDEYKEIVWNTKHSSLCYNSQGYSDMCTAPTFSQAFRWFREKHDLVHRINRDGGWWICAILDLYDENDQGAIETYLENTNPQTYEEAENACLLELINICKG